MKVEINLELLPTYQTPKKCKRKLLPNASHWPFFPPLVTHLHLETLQSCIDLYLLNITLAFLIHLIGVFSKVLNDFSFFLKLLSQISSLLLLT